MECGLSGGGGGGRSLSVGGIGRGLSLCRAPGAACRAKECKILLNEGSSATKHQKEGGRRHKGEFWLSFYLFLHEIISKGVEITLHKLTLQRYLLYRLEEITGYLRAATARH